MVYKIYSNSTAATRLPPNSRFFWLLFFFFTKDYLYVSHLPTYVLGCGANSSNPQVLILATDSCERKPQPFLTKAEKTDGNLLFGKTLVVG